MSDNLKDKIEQLSQYWNIPKEDLKEIAELAVKENLNKIVESSLQKAEELQIEIPDYLL